MAKIAARHAQAPIDPAELAAAAYAATINDAARLLYLTGSPLARQVASALFRVRDHLCPLPESEGADVPGTVARRVARIPPLHCESMDCGPVVGVLVLPVMPSSSGFLRPLGRFYAEALHIAREATNPVDAFMALNALRAQFAFAADHGTWRAMPVSAGACAAVEIVLLKLSSALGRAVEATAMENGK